MNDLQSTFIVVFIGIFIWVVLDTLQSRLNRRGTKDEIQKCS